MEALVGKIGNYLFMIGAVIAVLAGLAIPFATVPIESLTAVLLLIGALVGILYWLGMGTITPEESKDFLLAAIALGVAGAGLSGAASVLMGTTGKLAGFTKVIAGILGGVGHMFAVLVAPAALLVALKALWDMGKTR